MSATHRVGSSARVRGLLLLDHWFTVPLDHASAKGSITIYAREVVGASNDKADLPWLVYLQGGPGFESPRPGEAGGWQKAALEKGFRVLLLDQRGTGRSTRLTAHGLAQLPVPEAVAALTHFRADDIVRDCEVIRAALGSPPWSLLGQSFGGFCACTYLSLFPTGLKEVLITGGLAPCLALPCPAAADAVYEALLPRVVAQTAKFYTRFPQHVATMQTIIALLAGAPGGGVDLPSGGRLTPRGLQLLGWSFGSVGGLEAVHYLLESAFEPDLAAALSGGVAPPVEASGSRLTLAFLRGYEALLAFDSNPLYALLHEASYANGGVTAWAAQRALERDPVRAALLDPVLAAQEKRPVQFTGEMVFPFMFDDIASLRPLKAVAHALASHTWPAGSLYDAEVLSQNSVPTAATAYFEDMYVDFNLAQATSAGIRGSRVFVTNEYTHSGVREDGPRVLNALLALARDEEPLR